MRLRMFDWGTERLTRSVQAARDRQEADAMSRFRSRQAAASPAAQINVRSAYRQNAYEDAGYDSRTGYSLEGGPRYRIGAVGARNAKMDAAQARRDEYGDRIRQRFEDGDGGPLGINRAVRTAAGFAADSPVGRGIATAGRGVMRGLNAPITIPAPIAAVIPRSPMSPGPMHQARPIRTTPLGMATVSAYGTYVPPSVRSRIRRVPLVGESIDETLTGLTTPIGAAATAAFPGATLYGAGAGIAVGAGGDVADRLGAPRTPLGDWQSVGLAVGGAYGGPGGGGRRLLREAEGAIPVTRNAALRRGNVRPMTGAALDDAAEAARPLGDDLASRPGQYRRSQTDPDGMVLHSASLPPSSVIDDELFRLNQRIRAAKPATRGRPAKQSQELIAERERVLAMKEIDDILSSPGTVDEHLAEITRLKDEYYDDVLRAEWQSSTAESRRDLSDRLGKFGRKYNEDEWTPAMAERYIANVDASDPELAAAVLRYEAKRVGRAPDIVNQRTGKIRKSTWRDTGEGKMAAEEDYGISAGRRRSDPVPADTADRANYRITVYERFLDDPSYEPYGSIVRSPETVTQSGMFGDKPLFKTEEAYNAGDAVRGTGQQAAGTERSAALSARAGQAEMGIAAPPNRPSAPEYTSAPEAPPREVAPTPAASAGGNGGGRRPPEPPEPPPPPGEPDDIVLRSPSTAITAAERRAYDEGVSATTGATTPKGSVDTTAEALNRLMTEPDRPVKVNPRAHQQELRQYAEQLEAATKARDDAESALTWARRAARDGVVAPERVPRAEAALKRARNSLKVARKAQTRAFVTATRADVVENMREVSGNDELADIIGNQFDLAVSQVPNEESLLSAGNARKWAAWLENAATGTPPGHVGDLMQQRFALRNALGAWADETMHPMFDQVDGLVTKNLNTIRYTGPSKHTAIMGGEFKSRHVMQHPEWFGMPENVRQAIAGVNIAKRQQLKVAQSLGYNIEEIQGAYLEQLWEPPKDPLARGGASRIPGKVSVAKERNYEDYLEGLLRGETPKEASIEGLLKHSSALMNDAISDAWLRQELLRRFGRKAKFSRLSGNREFTHPLYKGWSAPAGVVTWVDEMYNPAGQISRNVSNVTDAAKNTAFGTLDFGVTGVQVPMAVVGDGVPAIIGTVNRLLEALRLPHVNIAMLGDAGYQSRLAHWAQHGMATNLGPAEIEQGAGTLLKFIPVAGKTIDKPIARIVDASADLQFRRGLGAFRMRAVEGNYIMLKFLQDVTPDVVLKRLGGKVDDAALKGVAASWGNMATGAGQPAVRAGRRSVERIMQSSTSMMRAQIESIDMMTRQVLNPRSPAVVRMRGAMIAANMLATVYGTQYLAAISGMADVGTVYLQPYDVTQSANVGTPPAHAQEGYMQLVLASFTPPAGCEELALRLLGAGATDDLYFDDAHLWPVEERWYELPSWVEDPKDIVGIGYFERGAAGSVSGMVNAYELDEGRWLPWDYQLDNPLLVEEAGAHPFRVSLRTPVTEPLYMSAWRPFAELSADSDVTTADRELVVWLSLEQIYLQLATAERKTGDKDGQTDWMREAAIARGNAAIFLGPTYRLGKRRKRVVGTRLEGYR